MEHERPPSDEFPADPAKREQMKHLMPSDEEIIEDLEGKMDQPYTLEERRSQHEAADEVGTYRAEHEKSEKEKLAAESLEGQITDAITELTGTYQRLTERLRDFADEGYAEDVKEYQHLVELEWAGVQNEIQAASPVSGWMGMRTTVPEAKRRELLGAVKHTLGVFKEINKLIHPSESGQE